MKTAAVPLNPKREPTRLGASAPVVRAIEPVGHHNNRAPTPKAPLCGRLAMDLSFATLGVAIALAGFFHRSVTFFLVGG